MPQKSTYSYLLLISVNRLLFCQLSTIWYAYKIVNLPYYLVTPVFSVDHFCQSEKDGHQFLFSLSLFVFPSPFPQSLREMPSLREHLHLANIYKKLKLNEQTVVEVTWSQIQ